MARERRSSDGENLRIRFAPAVYALIQEEAKARGIAATELVRSAVLNDLRRPFNAHVAGGIEFTTVAMRLFGMPELQDALALSLTPGGEVADARMALAATLAEVAFEVAEGQTDLGLKVSPASIVDGGAPVIEALAVRQWKLGIAELSSADVGAALFMARDLFSDEREWLWLNQRPLTCRMRELIEAREGKPRARSLIDFSDLGPAQGDA